MKTAFFVSGNGSNMAAILDNCPDIKPTCVITDKKDFSDNVKKYALKYSMEKYSHHIDSRDMIDYDGYIYIMLLNVLSIYKPKLIILAGYLKLIDHHIIKKYKGRIINIHPGPLPKYGGRGMYGINIHKAVIEAKEENTEINIHVVNKNYDTGKIIKKQVIKIVNSPTPEELASIVLKLEHKIFPSVINEIIKGQIKFPIL